MAGEDYGASDEGKGKTVCIDFRPSTSQSPLPHRAPELDRHRQRALSHLRVPRLRLRGILNHLGDWGTQFGKLIVAYKTVGGQDGEIEARSVASMLGLYVRFHDEAEKDPARSRTGWQVEWFKRIEDGDPEALEIFNWFKELTLREADRVYRLLNVRFDSYAARALQRQDGPRDRGASGKGPAHVQRRRLGRGPDRLRHAALPYSEVGRRDGHATRDITAAAIYRKDTYDFHKALYVVAYQQNLHFRQWFARSTS